MQAYKASPDNTTNAWPTTMSNLTAGVNGSGPFLRAVPNSTHYGIALGSNGEVDVTPAGSTTPVSYDTTPNPCASVS